MTTRQRLALASSALFALTLFAACGGTPDAAGSDVASLDEGTTVTTDDTAPDGGGDDGDTSPADREEAMLEFTECMRDHGIDMPDPQVGDGGMIALEVEPESDEFEEANEACEPIIEDAMGDIELDPEQEAEMREQLLEFSECMRDHGIDMPDPVFNEDGGATIEAGPGERFEPGDDEAFQAASEECGRDGPGMVFNRTDASGDEGEDG